jgi:cobalt/nickel transport system permease protein
MHISEGVLSAPVLVAGAAITVVGCAVGLKKMDYDRIPQVAILSSTFFVASLVHVPIGPSSVHLLLNGITGLLLGWAAFPAILVALTLQSILFQFGGITALGVNTVNVVVPALVCFYMFNYAVRRENTFISLGSAFACGFLAVFLTSIMVGVSLVFTVFLKKVKPEILGVAHAPIKSS